MYREEDEVYVFNGKGLYENSMTVRNVRNDEEYFTIVGQDNDGEEVTLNVPREHIMDEDEVDKIAKLMVEETAWEIDEASEIDEVNDYINGIESDHNTVLSDATLEGIVMDIAGSFSTIQEFEEWFKVTFSHYSQNGIYKLDGNYYVVIIG